MGKNILFALFITLLSINIFADAKSELKEARNELDKVNELIKNNNSSSELRSYAQELRKKIKNLEKKVKPAKKTVRVMKRPPVISRRQKRIETIYELDRALSVQNQYNKAQEDLAIEMSTLESLKKSYNNGAKYLKSAITKTETKIDAIKREITRLEVRNQDIGDDDKLKLKTGMMIDAYYMYNHNSPAGGSQTPLRNYDLSHNDFTVNLVEFNFTGSFKDYGFYVDLDFGEFAEQNASGDEQFKNVGQAYLTYEKNGYLFTFGKMYTNVGYEVAKSQENWNYSRSFAFTNTGPFWHEGLSLTKGYDNGFGWGLYLYDSWDNRRENNNEKTYSVQLNYSTDKFSIVYNFINGAEGTPASNKSSVHETNMQYNFSDSFAAAFNAVLRTDENGGSTSGGSARDRKRSSLVGYLNFKSQRWSFTPRVEYYQDENSTETFQGGGALTENDLSFTGITLTSSYAFRKNTELRFEVRRDSANQNYYRKDGEDVDSQTTTSIAWLMSY